MQGLVNKHTAIDNSLTMSGRLGQLVIHNGHVVWYFVIGLFQVHLTGKLFAHLVESLSGPVTKPV